MKYAVTIKAEVTKTYIVDAESSEAADLIAVEQFSVLPDEAEEDYNQEIVSTREVK